MAIFHPAAFFAKVTPREAKRDKYISMQIYFYFSGDKKVQLAPLCHTIFPLEVIWKQVSCLNCKGRVRDLHFSAKRPYFSCPLRPSPPGTLLYCVLIDSVFILAFFSKCTHFTFLCKKAWPNYYLLYHFTTFGVKKIIKL